MAKGLDNTLSRATQRRDGHATWESAAEFFRLLSSPMRLKIISSLCDQEKTVGELLDDIKTTQPNMSQHLNTLFKAKILDRRREGVQIYYRIANPRVVKICNDIGLQMTVNPKSSR